jgi:recombination protein RecA
MDSMTKGVSSITNVDPTSSTQWLSCYNIAINLALSGHPEYGLPQGRIINFEGESDTGKTLLALTAIREAQNKYGSLVRALVIDTERGMAPERCEDLGIFVKRKPKNPKKPNASDGEDTTGDPRAGTFRIIQTTDVSTLGDKVLPPFLAAARENPEKVFILMLDSVSMLVTEHERTTDFGTRDMARAQELRKLMRLLNDGYAPNLTVFLIHHQTDRIATGGKQLSSQQGSHDKTIGGGKAMKFVPSVRLEISYAGKAYRGSGEDEKSIIGQKCRIAVIKTRLYRPMLRAEVIIDHHRGFTQLGGLVDQLAQHGVVKEASSGFWNAPLILGDKRYRWVELESELEKPENIRKVVDLIIERTSVVPFGEGENAADGTTKDEKETLDLDDLGKG